MEGSRCRLRVPPERKCDAWPPGRQSFEAGGAAWTGRSRQRRLAPVLERTKDKAMERPEFPIEDALSPRSGLTAVTKGRPTSYRYVDSPESRGPVYTSLSDYWQLLRRYRTILLGFAGVGLFAALFISLLETPTYRVRTSLEIQGTNFTDFK